MRRRDNHVGMGKSFDSFLSIVTKNGLGMLILIAMATTFTSEQALSQPKFKKSLGTPLIKTAPPELLQHTFECRGARIVPADGSTISKQVGEFFAAFGARREELARQFNALGLGNDYYTFEFQSRSGEEPFPDQPAVVFRPRDQVLGDTLEDLKNPEGPFRKRLKSFDPNKDAIILFVRSDSFEFFRAIREVIQREGFRIGWHPVDRPLRMAPGGGRSPID
jgi:hypothetical protein